MPQGSVLGPALFNIFINDIYGFFKKAKLFNYADDNSQILTDESEVAIDWFRLNMMEANPSKFQVMLFTKSKTDIDFTISVNGNILKGEKHVKLLGVNIDNHMDFNFYVDQLCVKAARQLNAFARIRHLLDTESNLAILSSLISSNFNYCPLVWHFCGKRITRKMENILKRALRYAYSDLDSSYESLLERAGLTTLEIHRIRAIAIEIYKILNGLSP